MTAFIFCVVQQQQQSRMCLALFKSCVVFQRDGLTPHGIIPGSFGSPFSRHSSCYLSVHSITCTGFFSFLSRLFLFLSVSPSMWSNVWQAFSSVSFNSSPWCTRVCLALFECIFNWPHDFVSLYSSFECIFNRPHDVLTSPT